MGGNILYQDRGTRFKLFPQSPMLAAFRRPDTITIALPPGAVTAGPADARMYVIDALAKPAPYDEHYRPPYRGTVYPPVPPDRDGHFDYLEPGSREFAAAHMYATIRCVLDIWEYYFDRPIPWHFSALYDRLELIPAIDWDNAQSGAGFIEAGYGETGDGARLPHCLNFDVLAHELGHSILYSEVGIPDPITQTAEYFAFHESAADLTALVATLHFESVTDHLLASSQGNLYTLNELNRIGELSAIEQIRLACNTYKMSDFSSGWKTEHWLGLPLTGAIFDIFVDVFQTLLTERELIGDELAAVSARVPDPALDYPAIQTQYAAAYQNQHTLFKQALLDARDYLGSCLAVTWNWLSPHYLTFTDVGDLLLASDRALSGGKYHGVIVENFLWREIGRVAAGPRLSRPSADGVRSCRTA